MDGLLLPCVKLAQVQLHCSLFLSVTPSSTQTPQAWGVLCSPEPLLPGAKGHTKHFRVLHNGRPCWGPCLGMVLDQGFVSPARLVKMSQKAWLRTARVMLCPYVCQPLSPCGAICWNPSPELIRPVLRCAGEIGDTCAISLLYFSCFSGTKSADGAKSLSPGEELAARLEAVNVF